MRFALSPELKTFFDKNLFIELEGVLPCARVAELREKIHATLAKKLKVAPDHIHKKTAQELFLASYNLSFADRALKKFTHKLEFATLGLELFHASSIRFGFDQTFLITHNSPSPFADNTCLQETNCLSPLLGALLLPLSDLAAPLPFFPMPTKAGNALFISPALPLPWTQLFSVKGLEFLLIGYSAEKTLFKADTKDPHAVDLKKMGYIFNDFLKDSLHTLLIRKPF